LLNIKSCAIITLLLELWAAPLIRANPISASIRADETTQTQVFSDNQQQIHSIQGGTQIDRNLLHSFLDFSVANGWTAAFRLSPDSNIVNIVTRVTGSNASNIDGLISVDRIENPVNLFFINPNGIVFGPGAKLDLSGSFVASTADSVKFSGDYGFSAKNPTATLPSTLLTIGVPVGLQFGAAPAPIIGNFTEPGSGLFVEEGQSLALLGGAINVQGSGRSDGSDPPSFLFAENGRIDMGSVGAGETIGIQEINPSNVISLDFSTVQQFQDISIGNGLLVLANKGVALYGRQIQLNQSQVGGSALSGEGDSFITFRASELLDLFSSTVSSLTFSSLPAGTIDIQAKTLRLSGESSILTDTFDVVDASSSMPGLAGNIIIQAEQITLTDNSNITSRAITTAPSQAGNISINTEALILRTQSNISTSGVFSGNGGNIVINAGVIAAVPSEDSNISTDAVFGNGGNIKITTQGLFGISSSTANFLNSSDITARSEFGIDGTIDTSIVSTTPVTNLASLPAVLGQKIVKTECFATLKGNNRDSFTYSGRGGLPNTPSDPVQNIAIWQDLRTVPFPISQGNNRQTATSTTASHRITPASPIIEAQGFSFRPDGSVQLVAAASTSSPVSQTCASASPTAQPSVSGS
jgi:filamentous hemagglutinin family protein